MRKFGLIGYPLEHSFSSEYFNSKFIREAIDAKYMNYPLQSIDELEAVLDDNPDLEGLNVTIPYKKAVLTYLHGIEEKADAANAVNVIRIRGKGKMRRLEGFNTDIDGFLLSLKPLLNRRIRRAMILGTGGAAGAVKTALTYLGIEYITVSRSPDKDGLTYSDMEAGIITGFGLIVNTTPLGMYPDTASYPPLPYDMLGEGTVLYDLVYNPEETAFMKLGRERGCIVKNGLEMLQIQAEKAWEIWND